MNTVKWLRRTHAFGIIVHCLVPARFPNLPQPSMDSRKRWLWRNDSVEVCPSGVCLWVKRRTTEEKSVSLFIAHVDIRNLIQLQKTRACDMTTCFFDCFFFSSILFALLSGTRRKFTINKFICASCSLFCVFPQKLSNTRVVLGTKRKKMIRRLGRCAKWKSNSTFDATISAG